ncbi:hypothetical protein, partial [Clostridium haemolyticum]|uniref:hypothetical protein n=1 Tax=Clostridium haemolyticum TaxID=84025 RepID=UPI001FA81F8A
KYICFSYSGALLGFISILLEIMKRMYGVEVDKLKFFKYRCCGINDISCCFAFCRRNFSNDRWK